MAESCRVAEVIFFGGCDGVVIGVKCSFALEEGVDR